MIYLDNAATSFPKPQSVLREVERCIENYCGNPGRGSHTLSRRSAEKVYETRELIADFFGSSSPENVFFTYNDTYVLNILIKGLAQVGDHVIISDMEHNSVYRPIEALRRKGLINYDIFDSMCLSDNRCAQKICDNIRALIRPNTKMLIASHASNICSATLPLKEIGALCRTYGIIFIVDAAQSAGHLPIDIKKMNISALCAPGHKGLFGIQGSGFAVLADDVLPEVLIEGGSGVNSLSAEMPDSPPERYEAGTLSVPAIVSLGAGIKHLRRQTVEQIHEHESGLYKSLLMVLSDIPRIKVYAPNHIGSTLLFNIDGIPCEKVADMLDRYGICVRSGYHCSPLGHGTLGTLDGGAVRISFGAFNTKKELEQLYSALKKISKYNNKSCCT